MVTLKNFFSFFLAVCVLLTQLPYFGAREVYAQTSSLNEENQKCSFLAVDEGDTPFVLLHMDFVQDCCPNLLDTANKKQRISEAENYEIEKNFKEYALNVNLAILYIISTLGVSFAKLTTGDIELAENDRRTSELTAKPGFCKRNKDLCQTFKNTIQNQNKKPDINVTLCDPSNPPENCGNGIKDRGEECDDGRDGTNDGCDCCCMTEEINPIILGSLCPLEPLEPIESSSEPSEPAEPFCGECGNGELENCEECDDGNNIINDGCDCDCKKRSDAVQGTKPLKCVLHSGLSNFSPGSVNKKGKLGDLFINNLCNSKSNFDASGKIILKNTGEILKKLTEKGPKVNMSGMSGMSGISEINTPENLQCKLFIDLKQGLYFSDLNKDCCKFVNEVEPTISKDLRNLTLIEILVSSQVGAIMIGSAFALANSDIKTFAEESRFDDLARLLVGKLPSFSGCGNGRLESEETCDDGNLLNNDFCSNECKNITPGPAFPEISSSSSGEFKFADPFTGKPFSKEEIAGITKPNASNIKRVKLEKAVGSCVFNSICSSEENFASSSGLIKTQFLGKKIDECLEENKDLLPQGSVDKKDSCICPEKRTGKGCKTKRPSECPNISKPVCGCDEKTYPNDCEALKAGLSKFKKGECSKGCNTDSDCDEGQTCNTGTSTSSSSSGGTFTDVDDDLSDNSSGGGTFSGVSGSIGSSSSSSGTCKELQCPSPLVFNSSTCTCECPKCPIGTTINLTTCSCDHFKGVCLSPSSCKNGESCNDGNICTSNDKCTHGKCTGIEKKCDDGNSCTDDKCDVATGLCINTNNDEDCDNTKAESCSSNSDCESELCIKAPKGVVCTKTAENDCPQDYKCAPKFCKKNLDCGLNGICRRGKCSTSCHSDEECNPKNNEVCDSNKNVCIKLPKVKPGTCKKNEDCDSQMGEVCDNGKCATSCHSDDDCNNQMNEVCDGIKKVCVSPTKPTTCGDKACASNEVCNNGQCTTSCTTDSQCSSGRICDTTKNVCTTTPKVCTKNEDCDSGKGETCDTSMGTCAKPKSCTSDRDCNSNEKCGSTKTCSKVPSSCTDSTNCRSDQICSTNKCIKKCISDTECSSGLVCNQTTGQCETKSTGCASTKSCAAGEICRQRQCQTQQSCTLTPIGSNCQSDQFCFFKDNKCWNINCVDISDCPPVQHTCFNGMCSFIP